MNMSWRARLFMFMILDILQSFPSIFFLNNLLDLMVKNEVNVFDKAQLISGHLPPALVIAIESNPLVKETAFISELFEFEFVIGRKAAWTQWPVEWETCCRGLADGMQGIRRYRLSMKSQPLQLFLTLRFCSSLALLSCNQDLFLIVG